MSKLELLKEALITNDIIFSYKGVDYVICPWTKDSLSVCTAGCDDNQDFAGIEDMFNNWLIEGKPLKDIVDDITLL